MKQAIDQLRKTLSDYSKKLEQLDETKSSQKSSPEKWSKKEELGHLIDSAHNNLRRFIVSQYETNPKIVYNQNFWNNASNYNNQPVQHLASLWKLLNEQIIEVLKSMPETNYKLSCDTGKGDVELNSLEWLAEDYVKHMLHHLHRILELEPLAY